MTEYEMNGLHSKAFDAISDSVNALDLAATALKTSLQCHEGLIKLVDEMREAMDSE